MEKTKKEKLTFENSLKELETIAYRLESAELDLEESIKEYERGMQLAKFCHEKLEEAERKIEILQKGGKDKVEVKKVKVKNDTGEIEDEDELQGSLL